MTRSLILIALFLVPLWAPWMDYDSSKDVVAQVLEEQGPLVSTCYGGEGQLVHDGLEVRWYPFGRLVHTCEGDFVVWVWGASNEVGGVGKSTDSLRSFGTRPLACSELIARMDERVASTSNAVEDVYTGAPAAEADFSLFPDADQYRSAIHAALREGPNFAGTFVVAEWGCGSGCQSHAVVDVRTGRVVAVGPDTEYGIRYVLDSNLLVTNPVEELPPLSGNDYEAESQLMSVARVPREYYRLTTDVLSGTQYLVKLCVESAATGYAGVPDEELDVRSLE